MSDQTRWLVLIYKVPAEPTRQRATVWRRLKGLGAVYLQDGVAALPDSPHAERSLRTLRSEIAGFGGVGHLMRCEAIAGQREVVATYNRARDDEYEEIVDRCRDFEAEIEREVADRHLTYAELEENDEDLTKLKNWLGKVQGRDVLGAEGCASAVEAVARCEGALEGFATMVYEAERSQ
ncbi:MAG TPA: Chromate resistance protein ChrB [Acidimicrobiales bacterium]|nr:Chromate resistance protein ChrB [Acidimicrobiales bacterium]